MRVFEKLANFTFFVQLFATFFCQDLCNNQILISKQTFFSCELGQQNQIIEGQYLLKNIENQTSSFTLIGWYNFQGNMDQDYLFFQAIDKNNQHILSISLNPIQLKIKTILFGLYNPSDDLVISAGNLSSIYNNWFFLRITINLKYSSTNYYVHYLFYNKDTESSGMNLNSTPFKEFSRVSSKKYFDNQYFQIFIGQQAVYPYSAACSIVKQIILIIGQATQSIGQKISFQEKQILAEQVLYFNFGFGSSWPSYQFNQATNYFGYSKYNKQSIFNDFTLNLQCSESWQVGQFEYDASKGVMISIDFKVTGEQINSLSTIFLLEKQYTSNKQIFYEILSDSYNSTLLQLSESYLGVVNSNFVYVSLNKWHSTVRVFQGTFFAPCANCLAQTDIVNQQNCLLCQSNALTVNSIFSNYCSSLSSCPLQYKIKIQQNVCDYNDSTPCDSTQLSYKMRFKSDGDCICPLGTFQNQSTCSECPEYCVLCDQATVCTQYLINPNLRDSITGKCQLKDAFDDGISCISRFMKIPNRINTKINLPNKIIDCLNLNSLIQTQYLIKNDAFKIGTSSNSFFISLSFNIISPTKNVGESYTILFMQDQNKHIFTLIGVLLDNNSINLQLFSGNEIILQTTIGYNLDIWIGLYTDLSNFNLIIKQKSAPLSFYQVKSQGLDKLLDPELYVGGIISFYKATNYPLCGSLLQNVFILYGDYTMNLYPQTLHYLSFPEMTVILEFNFSDYNSLLFQTQLTIQNILDPTKQITFNTLNLGFNQFKGILIDNNSQSRILITLMPQFAFKFMIYPIKNDIFYQGYTFFQILDQVDAQVIALKIYQGNSLSSRAKFYSIYCRHFKFQVSCCSKLQI
ncbi:bowman-birk serine protease inhibitor family protein, putative (macronuclear) [Tetrahymena thermophila SB210]|uniref:Bowman-birk serine protease inhibitor family protein, putative n=1 Tax=Tetrahymena thermophila (strain SB210) TaxID=312017 RepID=Q23W35_TETTS|nr:bowman-birk serine protease inhibitor family protein, putative [Tetrahymena thermophila SB210]EAS00670.2 bowman-birk serine protease inhibitor family protein, putative [Tetrahymena thermophila SB210]|eukprot:XP_001020915.2 bowman-birk serine protease inhibitor family protein, putative [Tetrahymena thermophila SB210]